MVAFLNYGLTWFLVSRIHFALSLSQTPVPEFVTKSIDSEKRQFQSVLIIGCSVDRYAVGMNYPHQTFTFKSFKLQHNVVFDDKRNTGVAVLQHPGVGLNGNLEEPFWNPGIGHTTVKTNAKKPAGTKPPGTAWESPQEAGWQYQPTYKVIQAAPELARTAFGQAPDLVVVESSLWDLATWWQQLGHRATPKRLQHWCNHDLPYLLKNVTDIFKQSRVVFRTAPTVALWNNERWTQADFDALHDCVKRRSAGTGKVFEDVGVIDYHEIMDTLISSTAKDSLDGLWKPDGYHPSAVPGRLYLNEIFKLLGVQPLTAPEYERRTFRENEDIYVEADDDF